MMDKKQCGHQEWGIGYYTNWKYVGHHFMSESNLPFHELENEAVPPVAFITYLRVIYGLLTFLSSELVIRSSRG